MASGGGDTKVGFKIKSSSPLLSHSLLHMIAFFHLRTLLLGVSLVYKVSASQRVCKIMTTVLLIRQLSLSTVDDRSDPAGFALELKTRPNEVNVRVSSESDACKQRLRSTVWIVVWHFGIFIWLAAGGLSSRTPRNFMGGAQPQAPSSLSTQAVVMG